MTSLADPLPGFSTSPAAPPGPDRQASFDDLGTPLVDTTFVVLDLETTGGSPAHSEITEIGAVKLRGGECLGHFETLVNPGVPIPPMITVLTGITEAMVLPAPTIDEVLPALLEFIGPAVIVGHNVRFDIGFLDAALTRGGRSPLTQRRVDTLALARRLVRDDVPNLKLATLAAALRVPTEPNHRAMADARATAEVFHALLERAGSLGVSGLDDLLALPTMRAHPSAGKLALTAHLPRAPGVYVFRDRAGRPLYVGKATNLRARVRSYFSGDDRRKVPQLLRETESIDHYPCAGPLEAAVREARLVRDWQPRFNRQMKAWRSYAYLKLTAERFPRLMVTRTARADGGTYLGPFHSTGAATVVREAIESAVPLRRCTLRMGAHAPTDAPPCTAAQLGASTCPCSGTTSGADYAALVEQVQRGLHGEPALLLDPLAARMARLADQERFEEAAATRDRARALARALERRRALERLCTPTRLVVDIPEGAVELRHGRLVLETGPGATPPDPAPAPGAPPSREEVDELLTTARYLERHADRLGLLRVDGIFASALPAVPRYEPVEVPGRRRGRNARR